MARSVRNERLAEDRSFDALETVDEWTAQLALDLLPETNGPRVEVFRGCVVASPHAGYDHQDIEMELGPLLRRAARPAGLWVYHEVNVVSGDDLFIPDLAVLRVCGAGLAKVDISDAVLLGEVMSRSHRRKDVIDRPREYAAAGVPWFMRVDFRDREPTIALYGLADGDYRPVVAAVAGTIFAMTEPFEFTVDPGNLLTD
jgi:Uma2 family endonuclease